MRAIASTMISDYDYMILCQRHQGFDFLQPCLQMSLINDLEKEREAEKLQVAKKLESGDISNDEWRNHYFSDTFKPREQMELDMRRTSAQDDGLLKFDDLPDHVKEQLIKILPSDSSIVQARKEATNQEMVNRYIRDKAFG